MGKAQWVIQENHPDRHLVGRLSGLVEAGGRAAFLVPLRGYADSIPDIDGLRPHDPIVCYGPSFVPRALARTEWSPGIFMSREAFRWTAFRAAWGDRMLSRDAIAIPLAEAVAEVSRRGTAFVRPDEDSKAFDGAVYDAAGLASAVGHATDRLGLRPDALAVVAAPIPVEDEWRAFVVGGAVVAASSYRVRGRPSIEGYVPGEVVDLAFEAAAAWSPAGAFCLDVGRSGNRLGIVEANCLNASRPYGADLAAIVEAVSVLAERDRG